MANRPTRRTVVKGAAALMAVAAFPEGASARPEFIRMSEALETAFVLFQRARFASRLARPRLLADVRNTGLHAFFDAPETRMRIRARRMAQAAAENLFMPPAKNDAEAAMQERAFALFEDLGGSPSVRKLFPSTRRL